MSSENQERKESEGIDKEEPIQHLSNKLKKMKKMLPKLSTTQQNFSTSRMLSSKNDHEESSCYYNSIWTNTATGWTRQTQPVHSIPRAKRFQQMQPSDVGAFPELQPPMGSTIQERGVKFSKDKRHQLFTLEATPSPNQYRCRRYLEGYGIKDERVVKQAKLINPELGSGKDHIRGGTIGRFNNYEALYYPQSNKINYNEKLIDQARKNRQRNRSFKIRHTQMRNNSLN